MPVCLHYGRKREFRYECDPHRIAAQHPLPPATADFAAELQAALEQPLDFPPLSRCVVPGDRVVLAIDRSIPRVTEVVASIWAIFSARGVEPSDVTILQPALLGSSPLIDPRSQLPAEVRSQIEWGIHDPTDKEQQAYLATTAGGERVYLAKHLVEADFVLSIGQIAFDPLLGYRGAGSVFYPGLSTTDAFRRARGQGHCELSPDNDRPLRQFIDEVAWLLGTQTTVQVIAAGQDNVLTVLSGAIESVFRRGKELLTDHWHLKVDQRADIVVAAVGFDASGHGWEQIGATLANARRMVARGGKIVILSELTDEPGEGLQFLCESREPRDAIKPLREQSPPDAIPAIQLADALNWADVYLLSNLRDEIVEDLHMGPLSSERSVTQLLDNEESCIFLNGAQHMYGCVE